ncbi:MAG TPA: FmdB family zinc ribbon protein [Actinomycetaceae bacterium]|nr:FmdB family zinc ribbon protein [Actinomycetaceae bacterium]
MPTYAYRCTQCSDEFDVYQRFEEEALSSCPKCSGELRKLFTPAGIVFKGSGFYRTDSRKSAGARESAGARKSAGSPKSTPAAKD